MIRQRFIQISLINSPSFLLIWPKFVNFFELLGRWLIRRCRCSYLDGRWNPAVNQTLKRTISSPIESRKKERVAVMDIVCKSIVLLFYKQLPYIPDFLFFIIIFININFYQPFLGSFQLKRSPPPPHWHFPGITTAGLFGNISEIFINWLPCCYW